MADLTFFQQVTVSAAGGLAAAIAVGCASWAYFRLQERVRWQEQAQGELAKLRQEAVIRMLTAFSEYADAKATELSIHHAYGDDTESDKQERRQASDREDQAWRKLDRSLMVDLLLVPKELGIAFHAAHSQLMQTKDGDRLKQPIIERARALEPYLPPLTKRRIARSEYADEELPI
jgi:hypothetical protein